jgi:hypothetical protein
MEFSTADLPITLEEIAAIRKNCPASDYTFQPMISIEDAMKSVEQDAWTVVIKETGDAITPRTLSLDAAKRLCIILNTEDAR